MAVKYRLYQDNRKNSKKKGYWYARAVATDEIGVKEMAARISNTCTVTESDILAVISALVTEMSYQLKNGNKVRLNGLGLFRVSFSSNGVQKLKDFNVAKDVHSPRVLFLPETTKASNKTRVKNLLMGLKMQELVEYQPGNVAGAEGKSAASGGHSEASGEGSGSQPVGGPDL